MFMSVYDFRHELVGQEVPTGYSCVLEANGSGIHRSGSPQLMTLSGVVQSVMNIGRD